MHRMRQAADQRRHPRHLLRPWLSRPERAARSVSKPGGDTDPRYRLVEDSTALVGAIEGLAEGSTAAGSTTKDTLTAGCERTGIVAADGRRTPQMTAPTTHARHEPPMREQRTADSRSVHCRGPAPAAGHRRYSGGHGCQKANHYRPPAGDGRRALAYRSDASAAFPTVWRCARPTQKAAGAATGSGTVRSRAAAGNVWIRPASRTSTLPSACVR